MNLHPTVKPWSRAAKASKPPLLRESHIEQTIVDFLALDSWRSLKMEANFSERKRKGVGEVGMPDRLFIRYTWLSEVQLMWLEAKRPKGRVSLAQAKWVERERARGALVLVMGVDIPATVEAFRLWYATSGLRKRVIA